MSKDKEKTLIETITNKVKSIFADEQKAEEKKEENLMVEAVVKDTGITISAEVWEVGQTVTTITEEGDVIAIPEGTYELEDGTILAIDADGVILEITPAEAEEVEAEKKEEDMSTDKKQEPVFVTEEQLSAAMAPVLQALEKVATKLSSVEPKEEAKEETDTDKVQAENKLLKQRLSEKRKSIKLQKEKSATTIDREGKVRNRGHVNGVKQRVMKNFEDFDFTIQKSNEPIDLN